jgi:hypothetical protein
VDENATGSANSFRRGPAACPPATLVRIRRPVHFPSLDRGLTSGLWAIGLGLYIAFFAMAVDVGAASAFIVGGLSAAAIFFFVRLFGDDPYR